MTPPRRVKAAPPVIPTALQEQRAVLTDLQTLFTQVVEQARAEASSEENTALPTWSNDAQELLEAVEAYLRTQNQMHLAAQPVSREAQAGFWLDVTERCWIAFEDLLCEICVLFGMRGAGKSNSVAFILEQLLLRGVPMTIVDPHGEYSSLRTLNVPLLVVGIADGKANQPDLLVEPDLIGAVATFSVKENVSIILDLTGIKKKERYEVLTDYFEAIWSALPDRAVRRPYHLCLEEAHSYIPEGAGSPVSDIVADLITEYRKFGLGALIIDQRPARVRKTPISQARVRILHGVEDPLDVNRYKETVPRRAKVMETLLDTFVAGTALVKNHRHIDVIQVKERATIHLGATPTLEGIAPVVEIAHDERLVSGLRDALTVAPRRERIEGHTPAATHRLQEALERLAQAEQRADLLIGENTVLREQVAILLRQLQSAGINAALLPAAGEIHLIDPVPGSSTLDIAEARIGHVEITQLASQGGIPDDTLQLLLEAQTALEEKGQALTRAEELIRALRLQVQRLETQAQIESAPTTAGPLPLTEIQGKAINQLVQTINSLGQFERRVLRLLLLHEQGMTLAELAKHVGKTYQQIKNGRVTGLRALNLIEKTDLGYRALLDTYCTNRLQGADSNLVRARLLSAIDQ